MQISPWFLLAATLPILLLGEFLAARIKPLRRFDIPVSVLGGFVVALLVLIGNSTNLFPIKLQTDIAARWWTWVVTPQSEWAQAPAKPVHLPFNMLFFTCVGLSASWRIVKQGSWRLIALLAAASVLGVLQNVLGIAMCRLMHQPPVLGIICGSLTLTGGPSTAMGFAPEFEKAGFAAAGAVGAAAAMFGIVAGSLLGGPTGGWLIRWRGLRSDVGAPDSSSIAHDKPRYVFFKTFADLFKSPARTVAYLLIMLICVKLGASLTAWLRAREIALPVYMGSLLIALLLRNVIDAIAPRIVDAELINRIASIALGIFLAAAISSLDLYKLRGLAAPMLATLLAQVGLMICFAWWVTFRVMGRDYDAAIASAGHVGFGLGLTPNAVATMDVLTATFGPAPRAMLIVTVVGGFLIDFTNSINVTVFLNFLRHFGH